MPFYRVLITPHGFWETNLLSTTIWGHLAWIIRFRDGLDKFKEWLQNQQEKPWLISSWMPQGFLPRPKLKPLSKVFTEKPNTKELKDIKKIKKIAYLKEKIFLKLRNNFSEESLFEELRKEMDHSPQPCVGIQPHNTINRLSGTTLAEGGLYFQEVYFSENDIKYQFFIYTQNDEKENLKELLSILSEYGFGANKSTGKGQFSFEICDENTLFIFDDSKSGNNTRLRAMTLSHGVLIDGMKDPLYKIHVHFGKLGGDLCLGSHSPFKYPVIMITPGSTFSVNEVSYNEIYGGLIGDVHHALKEIRQYACHLPIYFREVSEIGNL